VTTRETTFRETSFREKKTIRESNHPGNDCKPLKVTEVHHKDRVFSGSHTSFYSHSVENMPQFTSCLLNITQQILLYSVMINSLVQLFARVQHAYLHGHEALLTVPSWTATPT